MNNFDKIRNIFSQRNLKGYLTLILFLHFQTNCSFSNQRNVSQLDYKQEEFKSQHLKKNLNFNKAEYDNYYIAKCFNSKCEKKLKQQICDSTIDFLSNQNNFVGDKIKDSHYLKKYFLEKHLSLNCTNKIFIPNNLISINKKSVLPKKHISLINKLDLGLFYQIEAARFLGGIYQNGTSQKTSSDKIFLSYMSKESKNFESLVIASRIMFGSDFKDESYHIILNALDILKIFEQIAPSISIFVESNNPKIKKHINEMLVSLGFQLPNDKILANLSVYIENDMDLIKFVLINKISNKITLTIEDQIIKNKSNNKNKHSNEKLKYQPNIEGGIKNPTTNRETNEDLEKEIVSFDQFYIDNTCFDISGEILTTNRKSKCEVKILNSISQSIIDEIAKYGIKTYCEHNSSRCNDIANNGFFKSQNHSKFNKNGKFVKK